MPRVYVCDVNILGGAVAHSANDRLHIGAHVTTRASTFLAPLVASLLFVAACGGPSRGAAIAEPTAGAKQRGCQERVRDAARAELVEPETPEARAQEEELLWLADHCTTRNQQMALGAGARGSSDALRAAWTRQAEAHADNPVVQGNLVALLAGRDDTEALAVLGRAEARWPDDMRWPEEQAHILSRSGTTHRRGSAIVDIDLALAAKAYAKLQRAETLANADDRFDLLGDLSTFAFDAGRLDDARRYADELLAGIGTHERSWNTGNLIHDAHTTLGRVALRAGDVTAAKTHLLAAGKTPGSPQLNSFGPDFSLAAELLATGERTTVDTYLAEVGAFWETGTAQITNWRAQLARGETPTLR
jgi:hypothetical protein